MGDQAKISITVKAGGNQADPWVVFHTDSVDEAGHLINEMLSKGVFEAVRRVSSRFAGGGATEQAVNTVQGAFPGAVVIADGDPWAGTGATPQPPQQAYQPPAQQLPASQGNPPCPECGAPSEFKQGTSSKGKSYKAYFCTGPAKSDHKPQWL